MLDAGGLLWFLGGSIGYVVVGYPACVAVLSRIRPRPIQTENAWHPTISVVIAAHNEGDVLGPKIDTVRRAACGSDRLQILVVDDASTDDTVAVAQTAGAQVLSVPHRVGKSEAINRGVRESTGDIVVLSDASAMLDPVALRALVAPLGDPTVGVVSGAIDYRGTNRAASGARWYWRYEDRIRRWETASGSTVGVNGNLFAFRRADFEPLPPGTVNDEFTIAMRIAARGDRVVYAPNARCTDAASVDLNAERARRSRISAGRVQALRGPLSGLWRRPVLGWRVGSHKALRLALPFLVMAAALLVPLHWWQAAHRPGTHGWRRLVRLDRPFADALVAAESAVAGATAVAILAERRHAHLPSVLRVLAYAAHTAAATATGAVRGARGRQSATWTTGNATRAPRRGTI